MVILVAVDASEASRQALDVTAELVAGREARVLVLSVAEEIRLATFAPLATLEVDGVPVVRVPGEDEQRALLAEASERLAARGVTAELLAEGGSPAEEILSTAERIGADLIVLGSHSRSGVSRFLIGSVSERVARHAHCSVLIARRRAGT